MYQIYGFSKEDRSGRVAWLCEELGVRYERKELSFRSGDQDRPEYLRLNPMGMVPTLVENGRPMMESCAILSYLSERHADRVQLAPPPGSPARMEYLQWLFFGAASLDGRYNDLIRVQVSSEDDEAKKAKMPPIVADLVDMAAVVEDALDGRDYLVASGFTAADIAVGLILTWMRSDDQLDPARFPRVLAYLDRLKARPAAIRSGALG